jgi:DNA-binding beta-propeller fold protein YncE
MRWAPLILGTVLATGLGLAPRADAGDRYYYMGYGVVQVIDGDTDTIVADIPVKGAVRNVDLSADRKFLYVTSNRHLVHKVDLAQNRVVSTADVKSDGWDRVMFGFVLAPDGRTGYGAFMSRRADRGEVFIGKPVVAQFELDTGKLVRSVEVPWGVAHLVSVRDGRSIYAFGQDIYKIDTTGPELRVVETQPVLDKGMNLLPFWDYTFDNGGVASMNYYTEKYMGLLLVDQKTGVIDDLVLKGDPAMAYSVVLAPGRKLAYAVMDDLTEIDLAKKTYLRSVPIAEGTCYGVNVSSDGRKVYVAGGGSTLTVYDAKTLKPLKVLQMASDGMDLRRIGF